MPRRPVHDVAAVGFGVVAFATLRPARRVSTGTQDLTEPLELLALGIGTLVGGRLPDWIDVPCSPNHRGVAHGMIAPGLWLWSQAPAYVQGLWEESKQLEANAALALDPCTSADLLRRAAYSRWLAALIVGVSAGYASHLVLDACTPGGLPLFGFKPLR